MLSNDEPRNPHGYASSFVSFNISPRCAVEPEKVGRAFLGFKTTFQAASGSDLSASLEHQVDPFFALVMMRLICATRRDFHEKTCQRLGGRDAVTLAVNVAHQQTIPR
jgi:hypothetical protein